MRIVNVHEAKTHLSKLVREAADGESFVIARSGTPLVKVVALNEPVEPPRPRRTGFYPGIQSLAAEDDQRLDKEIEELFLDSSILPDANPA